MDRLYGVREGGSKATNDGIFAAVCSQKAGRQTSSVVSEMTLILDTKSALGVPGAPALERQSHQRRRRSTATARVMQQLRRARASRSASDSEQDFGAQSEHANLKGRRGSACKIPEAPRPNVFDTRTTHRWRVALWRESSYGDLWYPCARTKRMICGFKGRTFLWRNT